MICVGNPRNSRPPAAISDRLGTRPPTGTPRVVHPVAVVASGVEIGPGRTVLRAVAVPPRHVTDRRARGGHATRRRSPTTTGSPTTPPSPPASPRRRSVSVGDGAYVGSRRTGPGRRHGRRRTRWSAWAPSCCATFRPHEVWAGTPGAACEHSAVDDLHAGEQRMKIPLVDLAAATPKSPTRSQPASSACSPRPPSSAAPRSAAFEREFAEFSGIAHSVGVANGTDALELALRAVGRRPGDEVIVPGQHVHRHRRGGRPRRRRAGVRRLRPETYLLIDADAVVAAVTPAHPGHPARAPLRPDGAAATGLAAPARARGHPDRGRRAGARAPTAPRRRIAGVGRPPPPPASTPARTSAPTATPARRHHGRRGVRRTRSAARSQPRRRPPKYLHAPPRVQQPPRHAAGGRAARQAPPPRRLERQRRRPPPATTSSSPGSRASCCRSPAPATSTCGTSTPSAWPTATACSSTCSDAGVGAASTTRSRSTRAAPSPHRRLCSRTPSARGRDPVAADVPGPDRAQQERVVEVLAEAVKWLGVFVHLNGLCESETVGGATRVWAFAHVLKGARVGRDCNICPTARSSRTRPCSATTSRWRTNVRVRPRDVRGRRVPRADVVFTIDMRPRAHQKLGSDALLPTWCATARRSGRTRSSSVAPPSVRRVRRCRCRGGTRRPGATRSSSATGGAEGLRCAVAPPASTLICAVPRTALSTVWCRRPRAWSRFSGE